MMKTVKSKVLLTTSALVLTASVATTTFYTPQTFAQNTSATENQNVIYVREGNSNGNGQEGTPYSSLKTALTNATDNTTIKLLGNVLETISDTLQLNKRVTIDGNNHKITLRGNDVVLSSDVTFKNVTISILAENATQKGANIYVAGNALTLTNVTFDEQQGAVVPRVFAGSKNNGPLGAHATITVTGTTKLDKLILADENKALTIPVTANINSRHIKITNGVVVGDGQGATNTVTINTTSNFVNNIVATQAPQTTVNFNGVTDEPVAVSQLNVLGVKDITLNNATVSTNNSFSGVSGTIRLAQTTDKLNITEVSSNVTVDVLEGAGVVEMAVDGGMLVVNQRLENAKIEVNNSLNPNVSRDKMYVKYARPLSNDTLTLRVNNEKYRVDKTNDSYHFVPNSDKNVTLYVEHNAAYIIDGEEVPYTTNDIVDYKKALKNKPELANTVFVDNTDADALEYDEQNNLTIATLKVRTVGSLNVDGKETPFSVSWVNNEQQVTYRVEKRTDGYYTLPDGTRLSDDKYNKDIVVSGDDRFTNINLTFVRDETPPTTPPADETPADVTTETSTTTSTTISTTNTTTTSTNSSDTSTSASSTRQSELTNTSSATVETATTETTTVSNETRTTTQAIDTATETSTSTVASQTTPETTVVTESAAAESTTTLVETQTKDSQTPTVKKETKTVTVKKENKQLPKTSTNGFSTLTVTGLLTFITGLFVNRKKESD